MRGRCRLGLVLLAGFVACKKDAIQGQSAAASDKPVKGDTAKVAANTIVVVSGSATVYTAADDGASKFTLNTPGKPRALRLIRRDGDWIECETIGESPGPLRLRDPSPGGEPITCQETLEGLSAFRLRLFVHSKELLRIVQRPVRVESGDGTWAEIATGAAVSLANEEGESKNRYKVLSVIPFFADIPADALGDSIAITKFTEAEKPLDFSMKEPPEQREGSVRKPPMYVTWHSVAALGSQELEIPMRGLASNTAVSDVQTEDEVALVTVDEECVRLRLRVPANAITSNMTSGHVSPRWPKELDGNFVERNAVLTWKNGKRAGTVQFKTPLGAGQNDASRQCFSRAVLEARVPFDEDPVITLCADSRDMH